LKQSLSIIHNPTPDISPQQLLAFAHPAQRRLVYEEIIAHQLVMRQLRNEYQQRIAPPLTQGHIAREQFIQQLPFILTEAQQRVAAEVVKDLQCDHPMQRLIQGDVGSGKTVIAALAAIEAAASGLQTAIMAPTELLAEQHYKNLQAWFDKLNITTCWLSGSMTGSERKERSRLIENGEAQVIIGTHALFQKSVIFNHLGLVIIDEQHRFGVHQRLALKQKGEQDQFHPHQLIMTATPIPRTLAMTLYADLDLSVIDQLPAGRLPVKTVVINEDRRDEVLERVKLACSDGSQVYWVCPLVEESELLQCQAAEQSFLSISELLPDIKVGLIHGRLKQSEKEKVMGDFKQGEIDLLVATTVIEVGVDVPNASLMVIENSERLGLAQLHQLRGRVGRGTRQSSCVLLYKPPLSDNARDRLAVMRESNDGFVIAQKDLEIRGSGELLGTRQTGIERFRVADLIRDSRLINQATDDADHILLHFPHLIDPLINRWLRTEKQLVSV
jgi:ATP-dependent DNA helicase RecG